MSDINFKHYSVMLKEAVDMLNIREDGIYVDCTSGGGGHSYEIAKRLKGGRLIALDRDRDANEACRHRLAEFSSAVTVVNANYSELPQVLDELGIDKIDGALWDLGVSSYQLDTLERGFSYMEDARLDMRMDTSAPLTAEAVVNTYSHGELARILRDYGEEKFAAKIASEILKAREQAPITTTKQLADLIAAAIPAKARYKEAQHPAKRSFQAIRIEVNGELSAIEPSIREAQARMNKGGRASIITFHSLEDRIVKQTFVSLANSCTCPPDFPICVCGAKPKVKILTKKPLLPSDDEINENPRSRSAKLRGFENL